MWQLRHLGDGRLNGHGEEQDERAGESGLEAISPWTRAHGTYFVRSAAHLSLSDFLRPQGKKMFGRHTSGVICRSMSGSVENHQGPGGRPLIRVEGDADVTVAPALDEAIEEAAAGQSVVIVDLSEATLIDSRTIGVLANWVEKLRAAGGDLPLVGASADILRLFRTIGLEGSFNFFPTPEAVEATDQRSSI